MPELYKVGRLPEGGAPQNEGLPFTQSDAFKLAASSDGSSRLIVSTAGSHVELLRALLNPRDGPFALLYVLRVPRTKGTLAGRYQSPLDLTYRDIETFLTRFREFFERDARHALWIKAFGGSAVQLVYDEHDLIYVYGPLEQYRTELIERAFPESDFEAPQDVTHIHHYHEHFDGDERCVLDDVPWTWRCSELQAVDNA